MRRSILSDPSDTLAPLSLSFPSRNHAAHVTVVAPRHPARNVPSMAMMALFFPVESNRGKPLEALESPGAGPGPEPCLKRTGLQPDSDKSGNGAEISGIWIHMVFIVFTEYVQNMIFRFFKVKFSRKRQISIDTHTHTLGFAHLGQSQGKGIHTITLIILKTMHFAFENSDVLRAVCSVPPSRPRTADPVRCRLFWVRSRSGRAPGRGFQIQPHRKQTSICKSEL